MSEPWKFLADELILDSLKNTEQEIDTDYSRYMFIELLTRIRKLEADNLTLRLIVQDFHSIEDVHYNSVFDTVKEFLTQEDRNKINQISFYQNSGISFAEWVRLFSNGYFYKNNL